LFAQVDKNFTILFVNNNSPDTSVENMLRDYIKSKRTKQLVCIKTAKNNGTAGGFNAIITWAKKHRYAYVGSLNADAIADTKWVSALVQEIENFDCAIATGQLIHQSDHTIDTTGDFYTTWGLPGPRLRDQPASKAPQKPGDVFGTTGGGFISKTELFETVGLFDETFFMYYEDVDLSFRTQLAGYKIRYTPKAIAYHKRGASSNTVPGLATYNTFKNLPMLFWKNVPLGLFLTIAPRFFVAYHLILGNAIVRGKGVPALKGWAMSLILHSRIKRHKIIAAAA
jgi:GT2 family glycosyltransferase